MKEKMGTTSTSSLFPRVTAMAALKSLSLSKASRFSLVRTVPPADSKYDWF